MRKYIPFLLLFILLSAWAVFLDRATDHFVFEPSTQVYSLQKPFEEITFNTPDGTTLYALYLKAQQGKPTILFFHGNKYNIYSFQDFVLPYANKGYGIYLFDYRGYGKSKGKVSEKNMYEDAAAALFNLILKQQIIPQDIVLWGFALGTSPALYIASTYNTLPFRGVILQSPYTNMAEMGFYMLAQKYNDTPAGAVLPLLLRPVLWNKNFDNTEMIGGVKAPILIAFSQLDRTVPYMMSRSLAAKAPKGTEQFFSPTGVHHSSEWIEPAAISFLNRISSPVLPEKE